MSELHWTKGKPDEFHFVGVRKYMARQPIYYACPACFNVTGRLVWLKPDHSSEGVCPNCQFQRVPPPTREITGRKRGFIRWNNRMWAKARVMEAAG